MKKQTSVEWLEMEIVELEINYEIPNRLYEFLEIAKQMEKEQIMKTFDDCGNWQYECKGSEDYYNKTYKK